MVAMLQQVGRRSATAAAKVFVECRLAYDDTCFVPCVPENPNFAFAAHENSQTSMQLDAYLWRYGIAEVGEKNSLAALSTWEVGEKVDETAMFNIASSVKKRSLRLG